MPQQQTITITPQYVNPPKPDKKWGSIKTGDGQKYMAGPYVIGRCQPGVAVLLTYEEQTWGGDPVMVATKAEPAQAAAPVAQAARVGILSPTSGSYTNGSNAEDIFVTGVVGRAMGSGQFGPQDIGRLVEGAVEAYRNWKSGAKTTVHEPRRAQTRDDLNDQIPF